MGAKRRFTFLVVVATLIIVAIAVHFNKRTLSRSEVDPVVQCHIDAPLSIYNFVGTPIDGYQSLHISSSGECTFISGKYSVESKDSPVLRKVWSRSVFYLNETELARLKRTVVAVMFEIEADYYEDRTIRDGNITVFAIKVDAMHMSWFSLIWKIRFDELVSEKAPW